jgi:poly(3-hydroxybutyrate) depolymerase
MRVLTVNRSIAVAFCFLMGGQALAAAASDVVQTRLAEAVSTADAVSVLAIKGDKDFTIMSLTVQGDTLSVYCNGIRARGPGRVTVADGLLTVQWEATDRVASERSEFTLPLSSIGWFTETASVFKTASGDMAETRTLRICLAFGV